MQIGVIGLGRMGGNIARRLMKHGHQCVVFDTSHDAVLELSKEGATAAADLRQLVSLLTPPRAIWLMLPAGKITEQTVVEISALLDAGDIIIDGGNSFYRDDIRRAQMLEKTGIRYLDVGTSGGVW